MLSIAAKYLKSYLFYQKSQRWSRDRIEAHQDEMLKRLIRHAGKQVPYYRRLFRSVGFDPESFRGREDLTRIPLLDKETVRTRRDELIADNARSYGITWESTSGSTGTPLHLIVDRGAQAAKLAALLRSYQWAGYSLRKKTFSLQSYYIENADFEYKPVFNVLRFDSNKLKKDSALKVIAEVNRIKPKFFMGFPFDLLMFSRFALDEGIEIALPDAVVTYGETLSEHKREALKRAYKCGIFDFYSNHEANVMIAECEHHRLHLIDDFALHEVIEANSDNLANNGRGELIGTGLYNYAMPLIRYRTRDDIVLSDDGARCPCGRNFPVVEQIIGKQCDYIETPDGRLLGAVMSHSIDNGRGVVMSQCIQDALDHIDVNLVVDNQYNENSQQAIERDLRKRLGREMRIDFHIVPHLVKRDGGKTPFILSKIGRTYV